MYDFFSKLFQTSDFPPRWYCGSWPESLGWLHIGSDLAIFGAYLAIPCVIIYFIFKRNDLPFLPIFWLFGLFIFFCGFAHLVEATQFWEPWYRFSGLIKFCTATISWITVFALFRLIPLALTIPSEAKKFRDVIDATPFPKLTFDLDGTIRFANRAAKEMFAVDDLTYINEVIQEADFKRFREWLEKCFASDFSLGESRIIEVNCIKRGGKAFPAEFTFSRLPLNKDNHAALCGIRDLTELRAHQIQQKKYVRKLELSNQELEEFCHIAAHDLKEPVNAVYNHVNIILEDHQDLDEKVKNRLNRIIKLTENERNLVSDLLYFSSIDSKKTTLKDCDINAIIEGLQDSQIDHLNETVEICVPHKLPTVKCEPPKIREVFRNLITNAIKYNNSPKKIIEIGVSEHIDQQQVFYVKDNGIGINVDYHQTVFSLFKRLHGKEEYGGGTGAGLSFVKKIIERHNGKIWIESEEGKGSTFFFTLNESENVS